MSNQDDPEDGQDKTSSSTEVVQRHIADITIPGGAPLVSPTAVSIDPDVTHTITKVTSGPIPAVSEFEGYVRLFPGAAEWFFEQAALDAAHTRQIEASALKLRKREITLQNIVPAIVVCVALSASAAIAVFASATAGAVVFGSTIASVLTAYLTGKPWKDAENKKRVPEEDQETEDAADT